MAITFSPNHNGPTVTIGGDDSSPFPSYSISRQENYSADDSRLYTEYSITVNGVATVDGDPTVGGQLHGLVHQEAINKLSINDVFPMLGYGVLKIAGYNNTYIQFDDARISSVQALPGDGSGGFRYQEYSIVFTASLTEGKSSIRYVQQVEESWNLEVNTNQFAYADHNVTGSPYKTFTLTHTMSATGKQSPSGAVEAWRQAVLWVESRLVNQPTQEQVINTHINSATDGPKFKPYLMNSEDELKLNARGGGVDWFAYNGSREIQNDIAAGSFTVTDTWIIAPQNTPATHTVETSFAGGQDEPNTVTLNGVVTGLSRKALGGTDTNKPQNFEKAKTGYQVIKGKFFALARDAYGRTNALNYSPNNGDLNPRPISVSVSENQTDGTITWSATFDDAFKLGNKQLVAEENVSVEYKNYDGSERVIAIMPVIGRAEGPVIQSFNTDQVKSVSVTVTLTMTNVAKTEDSARSEAERIAELYKPQGGHPNQFTYEYTEDYGLITLTKEWLYK